MKRTLCPHRYPSLLASSLLLIRLLSLGVIRLNLKKGRSRLFHLLDCRYRIHCLLVLVNPCFPFIDDVQRGKVAMLQLDIVVCPGYL